MKSMTGFGQASWQNGGRRIAVEVRAVNQRFLDVKLSLPKEIQSHEESLRQIVQGTVGRGKVDVGVYRSGAGEADFEVEVNEAMARVLVDGWRRLQKSLALGGEIDVSLLVGRGDFVRVVERRRDADGDLARIKNLLVEALRAFNRAREREGRALAVDMKGRIERLRAIEKRLRRRSEELVPELAKRLRERLGKLLADAEIHPERLAQEAAFIAERADVTEELVRLDAHLASLGKLLRQKAPAGKPIDFLLQEVHREINTIASKSADLEVTNLTLEARAEVEKLREQTQNVE